VKLLSRFSITGILKGLDVRVLKRGAGERRRKLMEKNGDIFAPIVLFWLAHLG